MSNLLKILSDRVETFATWVGNQFQLTAFKTGGTTGQVPVKNSSTDFDWSWGTPSGLPSQTGNSGKFLTTNGTVASWGTVVSDHGALTGLGDDDHTQYALANGSRGSFAAPLGSDDNYVTDAEKVKLSNLSGVNTGDQDISGKANLSGATFTGPVVFDDATFGGDNYFSENSAFSIHSGAVSGFRTALGLTTLATTTPGTGVTTALALAATGTDGGLVRATSPTLTTPNIGAATGTSLTPDSHNTRAIGASANAWLTVWSRNFRSDSGELLFNDGNSQMRISSGVLQLGTRAITGLTNLTASGTVKAAAYTINGPIDNATTTITITDVMNGTILRTTAATAVTITVPHDLVDGFTLMVIQGGAGQVTFVGSGGAAFESYGNLTKIAGQYASASVVKVATSTYSIAGTLA